MRFTDDDAAILRMIIYPVQFESNPMNAVDRVIALLKRSENADRLSQAAVREAIEHGLASDAALENLIPQPHSEHVIRDFLREIARRWI